MSELPTGIIQHDVTTGLPLPDECVDVAWTSIPYFGQRNYGDHSNEIGKGSLPAYLSAIHSVMMEMHRVLKPTGTFWLNVGDTYSGSGGAGGDYNEGGGYAAKRKYRQGETGIPPRSLCGVPSRVANSMVDAGWILRSEIVWDKGKERREDLAHVRRPRPSHEMLYLFAKTNKYHFDVERLADQYGETHGATSTVWRFHPSTGKRGPAPAPHDLVFACLAASVGAWKKGESLYVLDPFAGIGTTLDAAEIMGAKAVGFDLYDYGRTGLTTNKGV